MSRLSEITTYKNTILTQLIQNDNIVKALGNVSPNFLDLPSITQPRDLLFKNIFPYAFIPDSQDIQNSYITAMFKFRNDTRSGNFYKLGCVGFYVFSHQDIIKTDYPWLRPDFIVGEIDMLFNESRDLGIGKLQFNRMEDVKLSNVHSGCYIEYSDMSFN